MQSESTEGSDDLDEEASQGIDVLRSRDAARERLRGPSVLTVKEGSLLKRAQGKSLLGRTNWKIRFFVLTLNCLSYYDSFDIKQRHLKGQILLGSVDSVERVVKFERDFLMALHYKSKGEYTLHLQAKSEQECLEWLKALQDSVAACCTAHQETRPL
jgi:Ras GTPase-activating protein 3